MPTPITVSSSTHFITTSSSLQDLHNNHFIFYVAHAHLIEMINKFAVKWYLMMSV